MITLSFFTIAQLYTSELPFNSPYSVQQFQWNSWIKVKCLFDFAQRYEVISNNAAGRRAVRPISVE